MKADRIDLERVFELKSNKIDLENILDVQSIVTKQFKQILVLLIECVNCQANRSNDTKQALEVRNKQLIRQVKLLSNWVMNFDPIDYMNSADAASI